MNRSSIGRGAAAALFLFTGSMHFIAPAAFRAIVPPALPSPALLVAVSGIAEIAGAAGLLVPRTRTAAAYGLVALLVAVFPANIYMAIAHERYPAIPEWTLWARLPLQIVLVAWVLAVRSDD